MDFRCRGNCSSPGCSRRARGPPPVRSTCRRCSRHRPSAPPGFDRPRRATSRQSSGDPGNIRGGQDGETSIRLRAPSPMAPRTAPKTDDKRSQARVIAILVLVVILGGIGIAFALGSKNPPVTTTTVAPTTTEAPSTTTTLPSISHSLTKMVNDVIAGQSTHAIGPQVAQSISNGAQQAVTRPRIGQRTSGGQ